MFKISFNTIKAFVPAIVKQDDNDYESLQRWPDVIQHVIINSGVKDLRSVQVGNGTDYDDPSVVIGSKKYFAYSNIEQFKEVWKKIILNDFIVTDISQGVTNNYFIKHAQDIVPNIFSGIELTEQNLDKIVERLVNLGNFLSIFPYQLDDEAYKYEGFVILQED